MAEKKGEQLMQEAEKKANGGSGFFSSLFSDPMRRAEEAAELYKEAAIQFKIGKAYARSGEAYMKAADQFTKCQLPHEAASVYIDAATSLKKESLEESLKCSILAAETYLNMGRFSMAAKQYKNVAEAYESQTSDLDSAMEYFQHAVEAYENDDAQTSADKLKLKLAEIYARKDRFADAYTAFEEVASRMIDNKLLRFGSKEFYLKAGICRLCAGDAIAARRAAEGYITAFPQFQDTREEKLLFGLLDAVDENDVEKFTEAVREFDSIQKLDAWGTTMLLKVKKTLEDEDDVL
ncbi:hypothetical protein PTSG_04797 [Salpingoeca rosetta]|uniref:Uncharacterized protein n=1 Tax=Salpingoeca rosetta (strain ATCC 50818 / BSB-021) TaxID=946362 RepID=F2U9Q6_SALR5|nr:uncharacterized protein PTSG_04797 [Salpingoeca rosetta]EGD73083.1 hypothetical protein PTSG_04797 [Salpingoeca rosetta]|eukprot:XP_004994114.1 hypothetical protein PTSG_04797 [Salpingoeca rosetta]